MKSIILVLLGIIFSAFGLSLENTYAEIGTLIASVIVFAEALNGWRDWHGLKAILAVVGVSAVTTLVGFWLGIGFLVGATVIRLIETIILVVLGALGLHPQYKKALAVK